MLSRFVSDQPQTGEDSVLPFQVDPLDIRGRMVRLGPCVDAILSRHAYPAPVSRLLGEAIALTALLGSALKLTGRFQLQARTTGAVDLLVVDFDAPSSLRAYARFNAEQIAATPYASSASLLGNGHLGLTIDQGGHMQRYQGVVALEGQGLEEAAHQYFLRSEQIPTRIKLAVGENTSVENGTTITRWRAGGILVQFLPHSVDRQKQADLHPGDAPEDHVRPEFSEDDAWVEAKSLVETVQAHELLDPALSSETLLYRLFHERGVRVFEPLPLKDQCRCGSDKIKDMLRRFSAEEKTDLVGDDGQIGVTCEFCSVRYHFRPEDIAAAPEENP